MTTQPLDRRMTALEEAMAALARQQAVTSAEVALLSREMREFKDEMHVERREFKDEMRAFKDEMRAFKDEMRVSYQKLEASGERLQAASDAADRRMGNFTNQLGRLVEDIVGPSVPNTFSHLFHVPEVDVTGIRVRRSHRSDPGRAIELDAVAGGGDALLVVEVKSQLSPSDLPSFVLKLGQVRDYFPEWAEGRRVVGAVASFHVDPSLVRHAESLGLFSFGLARNLIDVLNGPDFQPRPF